MAGLVRRTEAARRRARGKVLDRLPAALGAASDPAQNRVFAGFGARNRRPSPL